MNRRCTDWFMCIIFSIFFLGMFATAAYGYKFGDPYKLLTPFDSDGMLSDQGFPWEALGLPSRRY